jgi:hypothetical protein
VIKKNLGPVIVRTEEKLPNTTTKGSPERKKFETKAFAGKVMLTVFWNSEDVISAFLEKVLQFTRNTK